MYSISSCDRSFLLNLGGSSDDSMAGPFDVDSLGLLWLAAGCRDLLPSNMDSVLSEVPIEQKNNFMWESFYLLGTKKYNYFKT